MSEEDGRGEEKLVPIDAIGKAKLDAPIALPQPNSGLDPLTGRDPGFDQELGEVGRFIGGRSEKAGNVAFLLMVFLSVLLIVVLIAWALHDPAKGEFQLGIAFTTLLSLLGTVAGYLFGKGSGSKE